MMMRMTMLKNDGDNDKEEGLDEGKDQDEQRIRMRMTTQMRIHLPRAQYPDDHLRTDYVVI